MTFLNNSCFVLKMSKNRITVLGTNMDGPKSSHCWWKIHKTTMLQECEVPACLLQVIEETYMTSTIFTEWLLQLEDIMLTQKKKVVIVDNCPVRLHVQGLTAVNFMFLPLSTTFKLESMDMGVIHNLKVHHGKRHHLHH